MGKQLDAAFTNAMATVDIIENRLLCLHYAMDGIQKYGEAEKEFNALHHLLCEKLNDAYRYVLLFAHVTRKEEHIKEARKIAYKHHLRRGYSIIEYLHLEMKYPSFIWTSDQEDEFREEIENEFKKEIEEEKEKKNA